jgi:hypothetical protein
MCPKSWVIIVPLRSKKPLHPNAPLPTMHTMRTTGTSQTIERNIFFVIYLVQLLDLLLQMTKNEGVYGRADEHHDVSFWPEPPLGGLQPEGQQLEEPPPGPVLLKV